jgi:light-regulated signal transduction histidine kinase (bacteriophytochrome)
VVEPSSATDPSVGALVADSLGSVSSAHTRRGKKSRKNGTVGMMDAFAVMSQVNEQLGAASDMDTFLKDVVGLVKDLTQFHRVLVYQFDESWNGQTVAELVDWNHTHDLYRGLHFPASDIPAQVG